MAKAWWWRWIIAAMGTVLLPAAVAQSSRSGPHDPNWADRCGEEWFEILLDGQKIGHSVTLTTIEAGARGAVLRRRSRMRMTVPGVDGPVRVRSATVEDFALEPPYPLLRRREQRDGSAAQGPGGSEVVATAEGLTVSDFDGARRGVIGAGYGLEDAYAEALWIADLPPIGAVRTVRSMDTDRMVLAENTTVLLQRVTAPTGEWVEIERRGEDGGVEREWLDERGQTVRWAMGGLEFVRAARGRARASTTDSGAYAASAVAALDRPLGDAATLESWSALVIGSGALQLADDRAQRVEVLGPEAIRVRVARDRYEAVDPRRRALALESTRTHPADDHQEMARRAAGTGSDRERAARLCAFVAAFIVDDMAQSDHGNLATLLARRRGDCSDHVQLFVTLARAVGIATRPVTGWLADGRMLYPHDWAEVALEGLWVPVDPTWNRCPADPDRLRLGVGQRLGVLSAGFSVRVEDVEHGSGR